MELKVKENNAEQTIVALQGELDTAAVQQFTEQLESVVAEAGKKVIIDFSDLEFISSAGMRVLLKLNKDVAANGGSVCIVGMSEDIRQLFQMTGFDNILDIQ